MNNQMSVSTASPPAPDYAAMFGVPALQVPVPDTQQSASSELVINSSDFYTVNSHDTMDVAWTTWATNSSSISLQFWYWQPDPTHVLLDPANRTYLLQSAQIVPGNHTQTFTLNAVQDNGQGYYLGKWVLDFHRSGGDEDYGITFSGEFNCSFDDSTKPRSWPSGDAIATMAVDTSTAQSTSSTATTSMAASLNAETMTPAVSSSSPPLAASASSTATTAASANTSISSGDIAAIVFGALLAIAGIVFGIVMLLRRRRRQARDNAVMVLMNQDTTKEKLGSFSSVESGGHYSEMPVNSAGDTAAQHEMAGSFAAVELPESHMTPAEMCSDGRN